MTWLEIIHLITSGAIFIAIFWANDDEPFINRVVLALVYAVLWLPAIILLAVMLLADGIALLIKWVCK